MLTPTEKCYSNNFETIITTPHSSTILERRALGHVEEFNRARYTSTRLDSFTIVSLHCQTADLVVICDMFFIVFSVQCSVSARYC